MEQWLPIEGYEDRYEVSYCGIVRNIRSGKILSQVVIKRRRKAVALVRYGKSKTFMIHRLVATAFVRGKESWLEVNHIDGDHSNNCADNLEWITPEENMDHALRNGLIPSTAVVAQPIHGAVGYFFRSINQATKCGFRSSCIYAALSGEYSHHHGYRFSKVRLEKPK